jgi:hypothetical protein
VGVFVVGDVGFVVGSNEFFGGFDFHGDYVFEEGDESV